MKITESTRAIILSGLRNKGVNKTDLTNHLGLKKSCATRLFNGTLKNLSDDHVDKIIDFLGVSFVKVTFKGKQVSSIATRISDAVNKDQNLSSALTYLADYIESKSSANTLPYIPTEDLVAFGEEMVRAAHEDPDKPGKVGRIGVLYMAELVERLGLTQGQVENQFPIHSRGCIAAGSAVYVDDVDEVIRVKKRYPKDHFALQVCGDSAEHDGKIHKLPSIIDGSTIILRRMENGETPKSGKLYAVSDGNGSTLKLIKGKKLGSLNPKYDDFEPLEDAVVQAEFVEVLDQ